MRAGGGEAKGCLCACVLVVLLHAMSGIQSEEEQRVIPGAI